MIKQECRTLSRARAALLRTLVDEHGSTAVEYGMLAALLGVVIATAIYQTGGAIKSVLYDTIVGTLVK
jgi:Flp pilus assembly pilin Flp